MTRYTDDSRERVREAVDFADLVGGRTELKRAGVNRLVGLCPFHDERSPSFGIDPVEKLYHCFGCGAGGDVFKFVMETESLSFPEALEALAERYGVEMQRSEEDPGAAERRARRDRLLGLLERTAAFYVRMLWDSDEAAGARAYLEQRGLTEGVLREFRVGFSPAAWDRVCAGSLRAGFTADELLGAGLAQRSSRDGGRLFDRFRGRLMFPLCDARGRVLGFGARALRDGDQPKYLNSAEGELFHKGRMVFGVHLARAAAAKEGRVVLVEGYTDVLALHQAGLRGTVASMGTALTEDQARDLARLAGTVVLCLDADSAGQEAMAKAARALQAVAGAGRDVTLRVADLPQGADPADVLAAEGAEGMRARVAEAVPLAHWQVERALRGDLGSPSARDAALDMAAEVILPMPPSVLKEELIRIVAGRLALSEELAATRLRERATSRPRAAGAGAGRGAGPGRDRFPGRVRGDDRPAGHGGRARAGGRPNLAGRARPGGGGGDDGYPRDAAGRGAAGTNARPAPDGGSAFGDPGSELPVEDDRWGQPAGIDEDPGWHDQRPDAGRPVTGPLGRADRRTETERTFLALCIALPGEGARRLAEADVEVLFASPVDRRAALHLREHAADPGTALPPEDEELSALVPELVMRARAVEDPSAAELDRAALHLELARLERTIHAARLDGRPLSDLAAERQEVLGRLRRLTH